MAYSFMKEKIDLSVIVIDREFMEHIVDDMVALIHNWEFAEWQHSNFLLELPGKYEFSFALYQAKSLCGFCIASGKPPDIYYIHLMFINQEFRSLGLGRKMLDHARNICEDRSLAKIKLRCTETNNLAHKFYLEYGFKDLCLVKDEVSGNYSDYILEYVVA